MDIFFWFALVVLGGLMIVYGQRDDRAKIRALVALVIALAALGSFAAYKPRPQPTAFARHACPTGGCLI